jgi:hypothetical protein
MGVKDSPASSLRTAYHVVAGRKEIFLDTMSGHCVRIDLNTVSDPVIIYSDDTWDGVIEEEIYGLLKVGMLIPRKTSMDECTTYVYHVDEHNIVTQSVGTCTSDGRVVTYTGNTDYASSGSGYHCVVDGTDGGTHTGYGGSEINLNLGSDNAFIDYFCGEARGYDIYVASTVETPWGKKNKKKFKRAKWEEVEDQYRNDEYHNPYEHHEDRHEGGKRQRGIYADTVMGFSKGKYWTRDQENKDSFDQPRPMKKEEKMYAQSKDTFNRQASIMLGTKFGTNRTNFGVTESGENRSQEDNFSDAQEPEENIPDDSRLESKQVVAVDEVPEDDPPVALNEQAPVAVEGFLISYSEYERLMSSNTALVSALEAAAVTVKEQKAEATLARNTATETAQRLAKTEKLLETRKDQYLKAVGDLQETKAKLKVATQEKQVLTTENQKAMKQHKMEIKKELQVEFQAKMQKELETVTKQVQSQWQKKMNSLTKQMEMMNEKLSKPNEEVKKIQTKTKDLLTRISAELENGNQESLKDGWVNDAIHRLAKLWKVNVPAGLRREASKLSSIPKDIQTFTFPLERFTTEPEFVPEVEWSIFEHTSNQNQRKKLSQSQDTSKASAQNSESSGCQEKTQMLSGAPSESNDSGEDSDGWIVETRKSYLRATQESLNRATESAVKNIFDLLKEQGNTPADDTSGYVTRKVKKKTKKPSPECSESSSSEESS